MYPLPETYLSNITVVKPWQIPRQKKRIIDSASIIRFKLQIKDPPDKSRQKGGSQDVFSSVNTGVERVGGPCGRAQLRTRLSKKRKTGSIHPNF